MKKLIAAALIAALALSMSVTAFAAEGDTTIKENTQDKTGGTAVHFSVAPTYTVTIPTDVTLKLDGDAYKGSGEITTEAIRLGKTHVVTVEVSGDFELESNEGATLDYTVKIDGKDDKLTSGATVAEFGTGTTAQSVKLNYSAANPEFAGNYRDTLTFTISAPAVTDTNDNN